MFWSKVSSYNLILSAAKNEFWSKELKPMGLDQNILQNIYFCVQQKKVIRVWDDMRVSKIV